MRLLHLLPILLLAGACSGEQPTMAERYPGSWHEDFHMGISKALAKNKIRGCGEFIYKPSVKNGSEYLVRCTRDGTTWQSYLVWAGSNKVMGPYSPDSTVD